LQINLQTGGKNGNGVLMQNSSESKMTGEVIIYKFLLENAEEYSALYHGIFGLSNNCRIGSEKAKKLTDQKHFTIMSIVRQ
jgi:hypothetical protein